MAKVSGWGKVAIRRLPVWDLLFLVVPAAGLIATVLWGHDWGEQPLRVGVAVGLTVLGTVTWFAIGRRHLGPNPAGYASFAVIACLLGAAISLVPILGILQAVLMGIGLAIAGVPGAGVLAFLTMIFSISQVLGPLVVVTWVGAAAWLFNQDQTGWAIFMLVWGALPVSGSDNIVRPLLIKRGSAMPLGLIILGVFGGLVAFGFLGLFIGPALLAVAHGLLQAWRQAGTAARGA